jgi:hypothetical protein
MGREIRRVPENWEHPRRKCPHESWRGGCTEAKAHNGECFQPMYDDDFDSAMTEWLNGYRLWKRGKNPEWKEQQKRGDPYWEWFGAPPDPECYHPKWDKVEWYQIYETVSEGTPVTPPFATKKELIEYLVEWGDYWDQNRGDGGWTRENAEKFIKDGWAPSLIVIASPSKVEIKAPRDGP